MQIGVWGGFTCGELAMVFGMLIVQILDTRADFSRLLSASPPLELFVTDSSALAETSDRPIRTNPINFELRTELTCAGYMDVV